MHNDGKIVLGLIVFLGILLTPFWYNVGSGQAATKPDIVLPAQEKQCIESTRFMKDNHMQLLIQWRDDVVRNGHTTYVASDGKKYDESLTGTCLKCHSKTEFCDRCHAYADVHPDCWNCHTAPQEKKP